MFEDTYCRLCAVKTESFINIYDEEGEKLNLATKIIQCLQIWLYPEDVLPKTICIDCCSKVNLFFDFFQLSSQSQISLMSMYNKEKDEDEKTVINEIGGINNGNNLDHEYEDDTNNEIREECIEYTNLGIPEKITSKRKLRTPIKHLTAEGNTTTHIDSEQQVDQLQPPDRGINRQTKGVSRTEMAGEDEEDDEESEDDDCTKLAEKEGYMWKCTDCSADLKTLADLRKHHLDVHNQEPVFSCLVCSKTYTRYRSYARHVKMHSNPKQFSCDICGKRFSQKTVLQSHATVHTEERPHTCPQCGKAFKQISYLYLHSKRHLPSQSKPKFLCIECPKEFSTKHTLETHLKLHTGERNFVCDICGKRFIAKNSLDYHIMTHRDTKPHTCQVCGKGFKTARLLSKHSTLHTGIKPHQCDVCGKQFRERGALKEHNRIHTGAMPYSCDFCGKAFRFKGILTVHRRQHTGERPYNCDECRRDFTNWANYNKHMKRRHRDSEHNSLLAARQVQREAEHVVVPPSVPSATGQPAPLLMQAPTEYDSVDTSYKVVEEDIYRVPNYVPSMSYYIPPIQHTVLQARSQ